MAKQIGSDEIDAATHLKFALILTLTAILLHAPLNRGRTNFVRCVCVYVCIN